MSAGGPEARYDPVRVQKLFFLIDREISEFIDGPHFHFEPYHYGPFDKAVYEDLDELAEQREINVDTTRRYNQYSLTEAGYERGVAVLNTLPEPAARYMEDAAKWIRLVPFKHLLSAIYRQYPDMAVNSVLPQAVSGYSHASFRFPMPSFLSGMARTLDFMGTLDDYRSDWGDERLDALGIYHDWSAVGDDFGTVMNDLLVQRTSREPQT
jgi:hypothetical protein